MKGTILEDNFVVTDDLVNDIAKQLGKNTDDVLSKDEAKLIFAKAMDAMAQTDVAELE